MPRAVFVCIRWCSFVFVGVCCSGGTCSSHQSFSTAKQEAVHSRFPHWEVYRSDQLGDVVYKWSVSDTAISELSLRTQILSELHLDVSVRSIRAYPMKFVRMKIGTCLQGAVIAS